MHDPLMMRVWDTIGEPARRLIVGADIAAELCLKQQG